MPLDTYCSWSRNLRTRLGSAVGIRGTYAKRQLEARAYGTQSHRTIDRSQALLSFLPSPPAMHRFRSSSRLSEQARQASRSRPRVRPFQRNAALLPPVIYGRHRHDLIL